MNIIELAIECRLIYEKKGLLEAEKLTIENFEDFAQAVIEDYKAGLVPVAHIDVNNRKLKFTSKCDFSNLALCADYPDVQLYAL